MRALREERRWSQSELAELADLDVSYVSQVERGLRDPSLSSLIALASGLKVAVSELLSSDALPNPATPLHGRLQAELGSLTNQQAEAWLTLIRVIRRESSTIAAPTNSLNDDGAPPSEMSRPSKSKRGSDRR